jgi:hypothetical protein
MRGFPEENSSCNRQLTNFKAGLVVCNREKWYLRGIKARYSGDGS